MAAQPRRAWWPWRRSPAAPAADDPDGLAEDPLVGYARRTHELLVQCDQLHATWLQQLEEQRRLEPLANAAAIYHWHLHGLRERLAGLVAPPALRARHEDVVGALDGAFRATHLLSHGYRFHNVRRICDGSVLLDEARARATFARAALAAVAGPPTPLPPAPDDPSAS